jgi:D-arabinose 1-dehydrogenase-like Zn-dependent alcohol dehydrogenase
VRAVVLRETGPAEKLSLEEVPIPEVTPGHALVKVRASGVCYRDVIDRGGGFPFMKRPVIPGHEFAGEIVEVGAGPSELVVGDRVANLHRAPCGACGYCLAGHTPRCERSLLMYGLTADGGYAEYVLAPLGSLVRLPDAIPFEKGCFLACTAAVALRSLRARAHVQAGETVLVTGASGGVGLHAMQVAKALGARVIAVTSQEAKVGALRAHGADDVLVSQDLVFHKEVKRRTGGVDVVLECVGARTLNSAVRSLRPMGRVVVVGNITVERGEVNPGLLILTELGVMGSSGCSKDDLLQIFRWVEEGKLIPALTQVLPLSAAAEAHRRLELRGVTGRLVLVP